MTNRILTGALTGVEGLAVAAEVDISRGLPGFHLVGLPGAEVRESRDRVLAALRNSGVRIPPGKITVNLAPAGIRKEGASYDLAIALGIVSAAEERNPRGMAPSPDRSGALILGELSLFGDLRPVRGLLAIVLAAAERGQTLVVVPAEQASEAALVEGVRVVGVRTLDEALRWWRTGHRPKVLPGAPATRPEGNPADPAVLLDGLEGQSLVRKAAILAAVGGHHLLMVGPPGSGKTRLARILARLQPRLTGTRALEVTRIQSAAGTLAEPALVRRPPLRAPHHTITRAGLVGGGSGPRPGEVTLAHGGMLFLDELGEFTPSVLDALRQPLEEGQVSLVRGPGQHVFPARFQLVAAMNPCRCGYLGSNMRECRCTAGDRQRYLARLSGPLLDRFDLFVEVGPWRGNFLGDKMRPDPDAGWREAVNLEDFDIARKTLESWRQEGLRNRLGPGAAAALDRAREGLGLSLRGVRRCLSVAVTLAALDRRTKVGPPEVAEALEFRRGILPQGVAP